MSTLLQGAAAARAIGTGVLPPGIAESNLDDQLGWCLQQLRAISDTLNCPTTLDGLAVHAVAVMHELARLRAGDTMPKKPAKRIRL